MSTLRVNTLQNTSGVEVYTCKAWVNFNGTGTVAIRAAGNVSSITDRGTGEYTINFTNALQDASYSVSGSNDRTIDGINNYYTFQTTSVRLATTNGGGGAEDMTTVCTSVFR